jgi:hypothetical protein
MRPGHQNEIIRHCVDDIVKITDAIWLTNPALSEDLLRSWSTQEGPRAVPERIANIAKSNWLHCIKTGECWETVTPDVAAFCLKSIGVELPPERASVLKLVQPDHELSTAITEEQEVPLAA